MIKLTRLDGEAFVLNADLIRYVERRPDTFVTLTSGDRIVVAETMDEVIEKAIHYQQRKHYFPMPSPPPADSSSTDRPTDRRQPRQAVSTASVDSMVASSETAALNPSETNRAGDPSTGKTL